MALIVFICTGNICRSPVAEGILRNKLNKNNITHIQVSSMGTHGLENAEASAYSKQLCLENGIDISLHRSRPLIPQELINSSLILVMELVHYEYLLSFFPVVKNKSYMLKSWPSVGESKHNVKDPIGRTLKFYKKIYREIDENIERIFPILLKKYPKN
jgi:protein-tyrosine-phosphatase